MKKFIMNIQGTDIKCTLEYKKRKTLSIEIHPTGEIKVKVPLGVSESRAKELIFTKESWIISKIEKFNELNKCKKVINYEDGDRILFLGIEYKLRTVINKQYRKSSVEVIGKEIIVLCSSNEKEKIKLALEKWYRKKALENILNRVDNYVIYFNAKPNSVRVKTQKRRWGSCSYKDDLMFNWKLIMAQQNVIDYVVVHEMCHINHKNHSKAFWENVEQVMPNYKGYKQWLKEHGYALEL